MTERVRPDSPERIKRDSLITLHYRVATADGSEVVATFGATPATLKLGSGELAPPLEACLTELSVGEHREFVLKPAQAFGAHNPDLVKRLLVSELPNGGADIAHMTVVEFTAPGDQGGGKFTGLVRERDDTAVLIDFNHPLAGKSIRFEVEVIGIL